MPGRPIFIAGILVFMLNALPGYSEPVYDLVLRGGHVIDQANNRNGVMDIAIRGGKIALVAASIPVSDSVRIIDADGYYVTPGLIEQHIVCYYTNLNVTSGVIADHHCLPSGVTTCCDGGSAGADNFDDFKRIISRSKMRILAFLNIARTGADSGEQDPENFNVSLAAETARRYPGVIVGFKTGHYGGVFSDQRTPWASIDSALAAGRRSGLPLMVDFVPQEPQGNFPSRSYRELILEKLRPGDIVTHCLAERYPVLQEDGALNPDILKARRRGVLFDLGHAGSSFLLKIAIPAVKQGFLPDTISADLFADTPFTTGINLTNVMSKFLNMGISLEEVIRRTTVNPARAINRPDLGSLHDGAPADIAVFEMQKGGFAVRGTGGEKMAGDKRLVCVMTVLAGKVVYDHPYGLSISEVKTFR